MNGINEAQAVAKYRNNQTLFHLQDGGEVVGTEVDNQNRLVYVIRRGNQLTVSHAENEMARMSFAKTTPQRTVVTFVTPLIAVTPIPAQPVSSPTAASPDQPRSPQS